MSYNGHEKPYPDWFPPVLLIGALVIGAAVYGVIG